MNEVNNEITMGDILSEEDLKFCIALIIGMHTSNLFPAQNAYNIMKKYALQPLYVSTDAKSKGFSEELFELAVISFIDTSFMMYKNEEDMT